MSRIDTQTTFSMSTMYIYASSFIINLLFKTNIFSPLASVYFQRARTFLRMIFINTTFLARLCNFNRIY